MWLPVRFSSDLLNKALDFTSNYIEICEEDKEIILQAKQSLLFHDYVPWAKKNSPNTFDVTMGSYDGAESCELVGTYLPCQLPEQIKRQFGLYRDDGLGAFRELPRHIENIKKQICKVFTNNGLRITIEANKKIVDFLDVTLDLNKGTHEPYTKPSNTPLYVHNESNHPPSTQGTSLLPSTKGLIKSPPTKSPSKRRHHYTRERSTRVATTTSSLSRLTLLPT